MANAACNGLQKVQEYIANGSGLLINPVSPLHCSDVLPTKRPCALQWTFKRMIISYTGNKQVLIVQRVGEVANVRTVFGRFRAQSKYTVYAMRPRSFAKPSPVR
jgi:hypothetical protein